jgi:hypothetical protein
MIQTSSGFCEDDNEHEGSTEGDELPEHLSDYKILKEGPATWS